MAEASQTSLPGPLPTMSLAELAMTDSEEESDEEQVFPRAGAVGLAETGLGIASPDDRGMRFLSH